MPPLTWLVLGDKLGDNAQVELIADALGWPFERKSLVFLPQFRTGKPRFRPTLNHLDRDLSAALEAPWPDLIITIGRRPSMAALAVRELSGNRSRVVMIGRPRRLPELALGVVTPQYSVPVADNVMHLDYPLMKIDTDAILAEKSAHAASMSRLPRPLTAVLVGGSTSPFVLDVEAAKQLLAQTRECCVGGTNYLSTSRRTDAAVVDYLAGTLRDDERLYRWQPDDPDNPYLGLLAHADRVVVTCDSISMMMEAARLGKPLAIFEVPTLFTPSQKTRRRMARALDPTVGGNKRFKRWLYTAGPMSFPRDLGRMQRALVAEGVAVALGAPFPPPHAGLPDESQAVAARIRALFHGQ